MRLARRQQGFSVLEVLVALTLLTGLMLTVLLAYSQGSRLSRRVRSQVRIQDNLRLALGQLERDLRMIGFGVPRNEQVGGSERWTPVILHASSTAIGFRSEIDGGLALLRCTPAAANPECPTDELPLDRVAYHAGLGCDQPGSPGSAMQLVVSRDGGIWEPTECSDVDTTEGRISVAAIEDGTFTGGISYVATVEQVYYRYVPALQPPYGYLQTWVRYGNVPDDAFPPAAAEWETLANHLTDFWLEYRDSAGNTLAGDPLADAERDRVHSIVVYLEGYDRVGVDGAGQRVEVQSEILLRNPIREESS